MNTYVGFKTDQIISRLTRDGEVKTHIFKNLKQSSFASTFLDIRDIRSGTMDIRCQFNNILPQYRGQIQYVTNETVKLCKVRASDGKDYDSLLYIYVFFFSDYPDDFLYFLVERQHIDTTINKKLVRTFGLQISTVDCLDNMNKMISFYNGGTEEIVHDEDQMLKSLFPDKDKINVRKL